MHCAGASVAQLFADPVLESPSFNVRRPPPLEPLPDLKDPLQGSNGPGRVIGCFGLLCRLMPKGGFRVDNGAILQLRQLNLRPTLRDEQPGFARRQVEKLAHFVACQVHTVDDLRQFSNELDLHTPRLMPSNFFYRAIGKPSWQNGPTSSRTAELSRRSVHP